MRTPLIAGNWKMHTSLADAHLLARGVRNGAEHLEHIEIVLFPPSIWLTELAHDVVPPKKLSHLKLGAQNIYHEEAGAFTGELSPSMVKEVVEYVLIGHSERTHIFKETPEEVNLKLRAALDHGLHPILCVGEEEKSSESTRQVVHLLNHLVRDLTAPEIEKIVVAYEPVWAVGSGDPATPEYAQEVMAHLRQHLSPHTRVLYGGSVTTDNARQFLEQADCDGLLIGAVSLSLKPFLTICQRAEMLATNPTL